MYKLIKICSGVLQTTKTLPFNGKIIKCNARSFSIKTPLWNASDTLEEPNIQAITNGDPELEHKIKVLMLEAEVMRQDGKNVPSVLKDDQWKELLNLETRSARRKYFDFLFKLEKKKENDKVRKELKKQKREESLEPLVEGELRYDLGHNNIFLRIYDSTINNLYNYNLIRAMQFSQKIVIDCGYTDNMTKRENLNCAKQLMFLFSENRMHKDPFDIHYCNVNRNSLLMETFHKYIPTMYEDSYPINIHEESYLDIFKKEELVYLTPHCREELTEYNHDDVYIIGAIVDKINNEPLSLAKAKKEGLRMAKLPLDKYLNWGSGSGKSLTLNQVVSVLLDKRLTGDWVEALKHVPKRKLLQTQQAGLEKKLPFTYNREENNRNYEKKYTSWKPGARKDKVTNRLVKVRSIFNE